MTDEARRKTAKMYALSIARAIFDACAAGDERARNLAVLDRVLLFRSLEQIDDTRPWRAGVHDAISNEVRRIHDTPHVVMVTGLLNGGLSGFRFAIDYAAPDEAKYARLKGELGMLMRHVVTRNFIDDTYMSRDLMSGAAGHIIAFDEKSSATSLALLRQLIDVDDGHDMMTLHPALAQLGGKRLHLGVAHGIAGILGAIAIARPSELGAILRLTNMLLRHEYRFRGAPNWPESINEHSWMLGGKEWCFGTSGILVCLAKAAAVLRDPRLTDKISRKIGASLRDADEPSKDVCLCHGAAGLAMTAAAMHTLTRSAITARFAKLRVDRILHEYERCDPFGFRMWNPVDGVWEHRLGLLQGSAGVCLALLTLAGTIPPRWARSMCLEL